MRVLVETLVGCNYLALIRDPRRAKAWRMLFGLLRCGMTATGSTEEILYLPSVCVGNGVWARVRRHLEDCLRRGCLTVFVDGVDPAKLDPLSITESWEGYIARLLLEFPDVEWLINSSSSDLDSIRRYGVANVFGPRPDNLFDASGLRDFVRGNARQPRISAEKRRGEEPEAEGEGTGRRRLTDEEGQESPALYLPVRKEFAVALDEETAYCQLHAYSAYRFGFRAASIQNDVTARSVVGQKDDSDQTDNGTPEIQERYPQLVIEDLFVSYADSDTAYSRLHSPVSTVRTARNNAWPGLERADYRIFVTSGQEPKLTDSARWSANRAYVAQQRALDKHIETVYKPYGGIYHLWKESGLMGALRASPNNAKGYAEGFRWPPKRSQMADSHGHSSPGALAAVAEKLVDRAERLLPDVRCVPDALKGAVLATDALELLGCRTPTLSFQALRLKHLFEVKAECQFAGVEHHMHLAMRVHEIERDVKAISDWFSHRHKHRAALNAEMQILIELIRIFREFGQFDEEQFLMARVRRLHNTLYARQGGVRILALPFLRYSEFLLRSVGYFLIAIVGWTVVLTLLFMALPRSQGDTSELGSQPVSLAITSFFNMNGLNGSYGWMGASLTVLAAVSGLAHLGIFISSLYTSASRR